MNDVLSWFRFLFGARYIANVSDGELLEERILGPPEDSMNKSVTLGSTLNTLHKNKA